jgi:glycosyltransferase involved in cell wall biosynthesis
MKWRSKYFTLSVLGVLRKEKPDIVLLGGFSIPSNFFAYLWAKIHRIPVAVFTERSRDKNGRLRGYGLGWRILRFLYRGVNRVITTSEDIVPQFRDTFKFGNKVVAGRYPTDIDEYFSHPPRRAKDTYTIIYPNRMTDIYNPIGAVEIFAEIVKKYPKTKLKMNASGELRNEVEVRIRELGLTRNVEFLDNIRTWRDLGEIYKQCDIMFLPAKFSNGNYTISECRASGMGCVISDKILGASANEVKESGVGFVLPLEKSLFVEKICWYIEHPEVFEQEQKINRQQLKYLCHKETAKLYYDLLNDLR